MTGGALIPLFITGAPLLPKTRLNSTRVPHTEGAKMGLGVVGRGLSLPHLPRAKGFYSGFAKFRMEPRPVFGEHPQNAPKTGESSPKLPNN